MVLLTLDRKKLAPSCTKSLIPKKEAAEKSVKMTNFSNGKADDSPDITEEDVKPKKEPSKDSPIRWASLAIYLVVSTPLIVTMVALVAALN